MSLNYSRQGKPRRLWRLAVATQPTIAGHQSAPCPEGTRIYQKPTASCEAAQLWDKHHLPLSWFRKAGSTIILNIIRDASVPLRGIRSSYSICLRSWVRGYGGTPEPPRFVTAACGTHPTSRNSLSLFFLRYVMNTCSSCLHVKNTCSSCLHVKNTRLPVRHANIVQAVKICYKIKIDYRIPVCCFYGILLCKQHPNLTIAPLLHYNSATIRM